MSLKRLWAQCLSKTLSQVVWLNNEAAWTHLQMLAKCTLCRPTRAGKSHKSKRLAWTRNRLSRWLSAERAELWNDLPKYQRPKQNHMSEEATKRHLQDQCINFISEGGFSKACKTLVGPPPLVHSTEVAERLAAKHPEATQSVDLNTFGDSSDSLVPLIDVEMVEHCIRSFHRLSGGGPSSLRPIHLKSCLTTEHRDEVLHWSTY